MKKLFCIILLLLCLSANIGQSQSVKMFGQLPNFGHWSTKGLVFYFRGIESGEAADESFNRNHGVLTNGATIGSRGLDVTGTNDHAAVADAPAIRNIFDGGGTIIMRVWANAIGTDPRLISKGVDSISHWELVYETATAWSLRVRWSGTNAKFQDTAGVIGVNRWIVLAATYNNDATGNIAKLYTDGVEVAVSTTTPTGTRESDSGLSMKIGTRGDASATRSLDGYISHVLLYDRILSASEIAELYLNPDLPMQDQPIWLMYSPAAPPSGIVPIIQAHTRRRRAG